MKITSGLMDGQVLQRNKRNMGGAQVEGVAATAGEVACRVHGASGAWKTWRKVGVAAKGRWRARMAGLPVGGPYKVEFKAGSEQVEVQDVFVGDVWFLGGQSNMQGVGNFEDAPRPDAMVRCFYQRDEWAVACEPLHFLAEAVDVVHVNKLFGGKRPSPAEIAVIKKTATKGVGLGVFFGKAMRERTTVPQGLVACAHGGTCMAEWSPALRGKGGASFYGAMLRKFRKLGQPIAGMLWYQGCSDASAGPAALYTKRMKELVRAVRRDFRQPRMPWAIVQIGRTIGRDVASARIWNDIQEQQRRLVDVIPLVDVVPAADLGLDDTIHISGADNARLGGERLARVMARLALGDRSEKPALRLAGVRLGASLKLPSKRIYNGIEVTFDNVAGGLRSNGRPYGFAFIDAAGNPMRDLIFKTSMAGNRVFLECGVSASELEHYSLHYGLGANPYVNIVDERDMAAPVFGPLSLGSPNRAPFITNWDVAAMGEVRGGVSGFKAPGSSARVPWKKAPKLPVALLPAIVMPAHETESRHGLYLFRASVRAVRATRLKMAIGSDSAIRIWLNAREVYKNLTAINPMIPDQYTQVVNLRKGENRMLVAFDARGGQGWGFSLRFASMRSGGNLPAGLLEYDS